MKWFTPVISWKAEIGRSWLKVNLGEKLVRLNLKEQARHDGIYL
jgi:hypothetical protein